MPVIVDALRDRLLDNRDMGVLYIDVEQYSHIEETYGWEVFDSLMRSTPRGPCAGCSGRSSRPRTSSRSTGPAARTSTSSRRSRRARTPGPAAPAQGAPGRGLPARLARRGVRRPDPQAHRRLRRPRAPASQPADARRAPRLPRARTGDPRSRRPRKRSAQAHLRETFKDILRKRRHPDGLPADLPDRDDGALRPRGPDARPDRDGVREPGAALRVRGRERGHWELEQLCLGSSAARYAPARGGHLFINVEAESVRGPGARGAPDDRAPLRAEAPGRPGGDGALGDPGPARVSRARSGSCAPRGSASRSTTPGPATLRSRRSRSSSPTSSRSPTP